MWTSLMTSIGGARVLGILVLLVFGILVPFTNHRHPQRRPMTFHFKEKQKSPHGLKQAVTTHVQNHAVSVGTQSQSVGTDQYCLNGTRSEAGDLCCLSRCTCCGGSQNRPGHGTLAFDWSDESGILQPCDPGCNYPGVAFTTNHRVCMNSTDTNCQIPILQENTVIHPQPRNQQQLFSRPGYPPRNQSYTDCCNFIEEKAFDRFFTSVFENPLENCFLKLAPEFDKYRLGDWTGNVFYQKGDADRVFKKFPTSIAAAYLRKYKTEEVRRVPELATIIEELYPREKYPGPSSDTIILHLRTGDPIPLRYYKLCRERHAENECDSRLSEVVDGVCVLGDSSHYIKPLSYFREIISVLQTKWPTKKHLTIVTGVHVPYFDLYSCCANNKAVQLFFQHFGYTVAMRYSANPDEDVAFMSRASVFVPSGGGFTEMIAQLVVHNNASVVDQQVEGFPTCSTAHLDF
eukprot:m.48809 g.48809  ORF g.48809 m.48809 type:complete len:460 (-) comp20860_c0_seq1:43-1422(-)